LSAALGGNGRGRAAAYTYNEWAAMLAQGRVHEYSEGIETEAPQSRRAVVAVFADLPRGDCRVRVSSPGFVLWRGKAAIGDAEAHVVARLSVGTIDTGIWATQPRRKWYRFWRR
jgi:hypothetical protein